MATTSTVIERDPLSIAGRAISWQTIGVYLLALLLFLLAIWLRLHDLGLPFDRDSYDEGVYWQTLRGMSAGGVLYSQVFYSQMPFFLVPVYPIFLLAGKSILAARLGIVLLSLFGFVGAFLFGRCTSGRIGVLAALLLLLVDPLFLAQSQTLQAEAPSTAFSLLAVGLIYLWLRNPQGRRGLAWVALAAIALMLSILAKLLAVATLVPIALVALLYLWPIWRQDGGRAAWQAFWPPLLVFCAAALLTAALFLLPFIGSFSAFWQSAVRFHTDAMNFYASQHAQNFSILRHQLSTMPLCIPALLGTVVALWRRDWRVFPLIGWFLATFFLLWRQVPLFPHHMVALVPPMICLAVLGIGDLPWTRLQQLVRTPVQIASLMSVLVILIVVGLNILNVRSYYSKERSASVAGLNGKIASVAADIRNTIQPGQQVITDAQFAAGVGGRDTPPWLVDTSSVRIETGYLTAQRLIMEAQRPQVQAILLYTGRLNKSQLAAFKSWYTVHFHLVKDYGGGRQLWVKS